MKLRMLAVLVMLSASTVTVRQARADSFAFSTSASLFGFSTSGVLVATAQASGGFLATGISAPNIISLIGAGAFNNNDNLLFPNASNVDARGLAFTMMMNGVVYSADIFSSAGLYFATFYSPLTGTGTTPVSFQLQQLPPTQIAQTPVTEPSSLLLLGSGLLVVAMVALWRPIRQQNLGTGR